MTMLNLGPPPTEMVIENPIELIHFDTAEPAYEQMVMAAEGITDPMEDIILPLIHVAEIVFGKEKARHFPVSTRLSDIENLFDQIVREVERHFPLMWYVSDKAEGVLYSILRLSWNGELPCEVIGLETDEWEEVAGCLAEPTRLLYLLGTYSHSYEEEILAYLQAHYPALNLDILECRLDRIYRSIKSAQLRGPLRRLIDLFQYGFKDTRSGVLNYSVGEVMENGLSFPVWEAYHALVNEYQEARRVLKRVETLERWVKRKPVRMAELIETINGIAKEIVAAELRPKLEMLQTIYCAGPCPKMHEILFVD